MNFRASSCEGHRMRGVRPSFHVSVTEWHEVLISPFTGFAYPFNAWRARFVVDNWEALEWRIGLLSRETNGDVPAIVGYRASLTGHWDIHGITTPSGTRASVWGTKAAWRTGWMRISLYSPPGSWLLPPSWLPAAPEGPGIAGGGGKADSERVALEGAARTKRLGLFPRCYGLCYSQHSYLAWLEGWLFLIQPLPTLCLYRKVYLSCNPGILHCLGLSARVYSLQ